MQVFNERIPKEKFNDWHLLLCQTNGKYVRNPDVLDDVVIVCYEPGDYPKYLTGFRQLMTPIKEARRDQKWRKLIRRFVPILRGKV